MPTPTPDEISDAIAEAAVNPAEIEVDGLRVKERPVGELIEAQRHAAGQAAAQTKTGGLGFRKMLPPGTV